MEGSSILIQAAATSQSLKLEALWGRTDVRVEAGSANFTNLVLSAAPGKTCYLAFHLLAPQKGYKVETFASIYINLHHGCESCGLIRK